MLVGGMHTQPGLGSRLTSSSSESLFVKNFITTGRGNPRVLSFLIKSSVSSYEYFSVIESVLPLWDFCLFSP